MTTGAFYLETLKEQAERYGLEVWGYYLMTNCLQSPSELQS